MLLYAVRIMNSVIATERTTILGYEPKAGPETNEGRKRDRTKYLHR